MDHTRSFTDRIEETLLAGILAVMTLITFASFVMRYGFNQNILWALELTVYLFGWLALLGASYAVKKGAHLGVHIVINALTPKPRRTMGLAAVAVCIAFSFLWISTVLPNTFMGPEIITN